jgi:glutathione peroxidase
MKKSLFYLSVLFSVGLLYAQTPVSYDLLFPKYEKGTAIMKNGVRAEGEYNYSTVNRQIQYVGDNQSIMTFEKPEDVVGVAIAGRYFENTPKNGFLERIPVGDGAYYVGRTAKLIFGGKSIGMGQKAQSYSTSNYTNTNEGSLDYAIYAKDYGMTTTPEYFYYLKKDEKFERFNSASSLAKAIGCCKKELKEFVKKENINFKNTEDVHRMMLLFLAEASHQSDIYGFTVNTIDGKQFPMSKLKGKKVMIVNVASKCGLTPQYKQLQELYDRYKNKNFVIVGFPANNFGSQEPGTNEEIKAFCTMNYGVTFPMMAKISVKGDDIDPLYQWLTTKTGNGVSDAEVSWNFQKFLIDETGHWVKFIAPKESPLLEEIIDWIEKK